MAKTLSQVGREEKFVTVTKATCDQPSARLLSAEKLSFRSEVKNRTTTAPLVTGGHHAGAGRLGQEKGNTYPSQKWRSKRVVVADDTNFYVENAKDATETRRETRTNPVEWQDANRRTEVHCGLHTNDGVSNTAVWETPSAVATTRTKYLGIT